MKNINTKITTILLGLILITSNNIFSQVLITDDGTTSPDESAMLEIKSSNKGMLIPRMSTANREALQNSSTAKPGLLVFDSDLGSFFIYGKTAKGTNGWVDLSSGGTIWEKSGNNIYLANSNYNVGIGTDKPSKKFVIKAENQNDTLFEILDSYGKPLMLITPTLSKFYFNETNTKGIAGGFAVGRYAGAKANILDTALFLVTPDSTRVYTSGTSTKGIAGGFAVGRYAGAKEGGILKYFYTDIDSTRVYTDGSGTKGIAGGFAVGRYAGAKSNTGNYMYMVPDNYFIGDNSGLNIQQDPSLSSKYNTFFGYETGMINEVGGSNVFIGYKSGINNNGEIIGVDTTGSKNVFLGFKAGFSNTTGKNNVLLGANSGSSMTESDFNTIIGCSAGEKAQSGIRNVFMGYNAGLNHFGGNDNIFIGNNSGASDPSYDKISERNVILGIDAGANLKEAIDNIFIGHLAGEGFENDGVTGDYNVIIGESAGRLLEDGVSNLIIGRLTGYNITSGQRNVFLGNKAGLKNSNGSYNVFIGDSAGYSCSSGLQNVAIGDMAGSNLTSNYNVLLGNGAGYETTSGLGNTMVGNWSGKLNISGGYNSYFGYNAGYDIDGYFNIVIGQHTNSGTTTARTGSYNLFLGRNAGEWETGSNKLYIENSNTITSNPLIYGEFDNDYVRIGGTLNINNAYSFPTSDGTNGYVLTTDGSGNVSWTSKNANTDETTASNGLYKTGVDVRLGGTLIENTTINTNSYTLELSTASGDETLIIEADTDNNNEADNPKISFRQDGGAVIGNIGFEGNGGTTYTGSLWNSFYLVTESDLPLQFGTNNTARLTIKESGEIGIGTTSPSNQLSIYKAGNVAAKIYTDNGNSSSLKLFENTSGTDYGYEFEYDGSSDKLHLWSKGFIDNAGIKVTFLKDGKVGIGTTDPSYKLEVLDDSNAIYAKTTGSDTNYSIVGYATGGTSNYAIYGVAANGSNNWAGYFNGGLKVTGEVSKNITTLTGSYTITDTDGYYTILVNNSATATITLPTASTNTGRIIRIKRVGSYYVYIDAQGSELLDGSTGQKVMDVKYEGYIVQSDGSNWWVIGIINDSFK